MWLFISFHFSSALKSVLRKTRSNVVNAPNSSGGSNPKEANKVKPEAGYDFIEGSGKFTEKKLLKSRNLFLTQWSIITGFVIEGLEDKGLDAKSYIQQMLRRTDGSSREEQIIQKVIFFKDFYTFLLYRSIFVRSSSFCRTWGEHVLYKNCSECHKQFLYTTFSPQVWAWNFHVLNL